MSNALHLERLRFGDEDRGDVLDKIWEPVLKSSQGEEYARMSIVKHLAVHTALYILLDRFFCFFPFFLLFSFPCLPLFLKTQHTEHKNDGDH